MQDKFYALVEQINVELKENIPNDETLHLMRSRVNSYLGTLVHFSSFKLRKKVLIGFDDVFHHYFVLDKDFSKVVLKQYY